MSQNPYEAEDQFWQKVDDAEDLFFDVVDTVEETWRDTPRGIRRAITFGAAVLVLGLAVNSASGSFGGQAEAAPGSPEVPVQPAPPAPEAAPAPVVPETVPPTTPTPERPPYEERHLGRSVSPELLARLEYNVLKVSTSAGECTGTFIEQEAQRYLITAGHCEPTNGSASSIIVSQPGKVPVRMESYESSNHNPDILVARPEGNGLDLPAVTIESFNNSIPEVGTQFALASLPNLATTPVISTLTFVGRTTVHTEKGESKDVWVMIPNANEDPEASGHVCEPGGSGGLAGSDKGHFAAHFATADPDLMPPVVWESRKQTLGQELGTDLSQASAICFMTGLNDAIIDDFQSRL